MKLTGCVLILWSAGYGWLTLRKQMLRPLRAAQALLEDLAILKSRICTGQSPLPQILQEDLNSGLMAAELWQPLGQKLNHRVSPSLSHLWLEQTGTLPPPLDRILSPLGPLLGEGGSILGQAIDETREELTGFIRSERAKQAANGRTGAALCFSAALLVILVLI